MAYQATTIVPQTEDWTEEADRAALLLRFRERKRTAVEAYIPQTEDWETEAGHPSFVLSSRTPSAAQKKKWSSWCRSCHGRCGYTH